MHNSKFKMGHRFQSTNIKDTFTWNLSCFFGQSLDYDHEFDQSLKFRIVCQPWDKVVIWPGFTLTFTNGCQKRQCLMKVDVSFFNIATSFCGNWNCLNHYWLICIVWIWSLFPISHQFDKCFAPLINDVSTELLEHLDALSWYFS